MRISNKPGDAVLSLDGTVKVNRKYVGIWRRVYFEDIGRHFYYFAIAESAEPLVWSYFCHLFRAAIPKYLSKLGIEGHQSAAPKKLQRDMDVNEKKRRSSGAKYSHITRNLRNKEPLTGKTLDLALGLVGDGTQGDELMDNISKKLQTGQQLSEYEHHIMVDVLLRRR